MKRDIIEFVSRCLVCQQVKAEHHRPASLLQRIKIPKWKWERITMDFVMRLPRTSRGHDAICVIVDQMTKSTQFFLVKERELFPMSSSYYPSQPFYTSKEWIT